MKRYRSGFKVSNFNRDKRDTKLSTKTVPIKSHTVIQSLAEIMIPSKHKHQKIQEYVALVKIGQVNIWAQINQSSFLYKNTQQISIIENLLEISGFKSNNKVLQGEIELIEKDRIPKQYYLQYAQVLIKGIYVSRRDQYKIVKYIEKCPIHVYNRKITCFHDLKLYFTNMLNHKGEIAKSGMVNKNTKLIYRTTCSKYSILFEITEQMFDLNQKKQLYLEKAIDFLLLFFLRNNFFQTDHRIQIYLFARLFYPDYQTLDQAYQYLRKTLNQNQNKNNKFPINHASALQKDIQGRIYQDVYRRILWNNRQLLEFRTKFTRKISEFIFTMNLKNSQSYVKYIRDTIYEIHQSQFKQAQISQLKQFMSPYIQKIPGSLAKSKDCCLFQGISLISQQYKHHYVFRSLKETGNTIMCISAGYSHYKTDKTTYKMAKSNVYLTNIHSVFINLRRYTQAIKVEIYDLQQKPVYKANKSQQSKDVKRLIGLVDWIKQRIAYNTPKSMTLTFPQHNFQLKSLIYPQNLKKIPQQKLKQIFKGSQNIIHQPLMKEYYQNKQKPNEKFEYTIKTKQIKWIRPIILNQNSYSVHNILYSHLPFNWTPFTSKKKMKQDTIERDLRLIINKKTDYDLGCIGEESQASNLISRYIKDKKLKNEKSSDQEIEVQVLIIDEQSLHKQDKQKYKKSKQEEKIISSLFQITSQQKKQPLIFQPFKFNSHFNDSSGSPRSVKSLKSQQIIPNHKFNKPKLQIVNIIKKPTVNIFEQTFKRGQYMKKAHQQITTGNQNQKKSSNNKDRSKKNYRNCPLHYIMTFFDQKTLNNIENTILLKKQSKLWKMDESRLDQQLILQKQWKDIVFPILTPLYTPYIKKQENGQRQKRNVINTDFGQFIIQEKICKYLMENFQIQQNSTYQNINLIKGQVRVSLHDQINVMTYEAVDTKRQEQIIPRMFYRYLSYEDKDLRFGSKFITFSDQNYYSQQVKQQKKSIKLAFITHKTKQETGSNLQQFFQLIHQKYPELHIQLKCSGSYQQAPYKRKFKGMNLAKNNNNNIYRNQIVDITIDQSYYPLNLFSILIQWDHCCAVYINQLLQNLKIISKKCKLKYHLISNKNQFEAEWTISTVSEIVMGSQISIQMLDKYILQSEDWLWDQCGYYLNKDGLAFLRFIKDKNLVQWKDNQLQKNIWQNLQSIKAFKKFSLYCEALNILGGIINRI